MVTTFWQKVVVVTGYFAAGCIILAALIVSATRVATPLLNDHLPEFEKFASDLLGRPVTISHVAVAWNFYEPELIFQKVALTDPSTAKPSLEVPQINIQLALVRSLVARQPILNSIKIMGARLTLHQQAKGQIQLEGFKDFAIVDNLTGESQNAKAIGAWIFSQPYLILQDIDVHFISEKDPPKWITLQQLALHNTATQHTLNGEAFLHQKIPTQVTIQFKWEGDITDFSNLLISTVLYSMYKHKTLTTY